MDPVADKTLQHSVASPAPLTVGASETMGRGVFTTSPVLPGATIARVDAELVFDARRALGSRYIDSTDFASDVDAEDDPYAVLCLFLYRFLYASDDVVRDESTALGLYRDVLLADSSSCVLDWTRDEVDMLAGSHLHALAMQLRQTADASAAKVERWLGGAGGCHAATVDTTRIRRCLSILLTRLVRLDDGSVALVPGLDLFNHSSESSTYITGTREGVRIVNQDGFLRSGQQAFISYGGKTSGELLISYGFCPDQNPHDGVLVPFEDDFVVVVGLDGGVRVRGSGGPAVEERVRGELKARVRAQLSGRVKDGNVDACEGPLGTTIQELMALERKILSRTLYRV